MRIRINSERNTLFPFNLNPPCIFDWQLEAGQRLQKVKGHIMHLHGGNDEISNRKFGLILQLDAFLLKLLLLFNFLHLAMLWSLGSQALDSVVSFPGTVN